MLRYRLESFALRLAETILKILPLEAASNLSGSLWRHLGPLVGNRRHRRALANLALAYPDLSPKQRAALAASMWDNLGRTFAESFRLAEIAKSNRLLFDLPQGFRDDPAARVVCAPHQGNWEIAGLAVSSGATQPAGVYQKIKNPFVDARVRKIREFLYPGGLFP
ncbi:MAG TPA: lipid A biosynthesis acyltransferase, partial [Methylovirgula sp.]